MFSREHIYKGVPYIIERDVQGWRTLCRRRRAAPVESGLRAQVELKNAWPSKWADTREEAVEQFEKWVDKTIPLD